MIAVIGAGFAGLSAALELRRKGCDVTVLEKSSAPGGMAGYFCFTGSSEPLEPIYHHIFTSDTYVRDLAEELGTAHKLKWLEPKDGMLKNGKVYPFTSPVDLMCFTPVRFFDRIRMGLTVLKAGRLSDFDHLEQTTAREWLLKNVGESCYEAVWKELLRSKFDNDAEKVSAVWIWNKFKLRGNSRGKEISKEKLGYYDGGFGVLAQELADKLTEIGVNILYNTPVEKITASGTGYTLSCGGIDLAAEKVLCTLDTIRFSEMTADLPLADAYRQKLANMQYKANLCLVLRLKKSLSKYYWMTVCDNHPYVVAVDHNNLVGDRDYGGRVLYLSRYLDVSDPLWSTDDAGVTEVFCEDLLRTFPHLTREDILETRLTRTRCSQPVVGLNYSKTHPGMDTGLPGLVLAGMAQIYPEDRGMNYAIRCGKEAAGLLLKEDVR